MLAAAIGAWVTFHAAEIRHLHRSQDRGPQGREPAHRRGDQGEGGQDGSLQGVADTEEQCLIRPRRLSAKAPAMCRVFIFVMLRLQVEWKKQISDLQNISLSYEVFGLPTRRQGRPSHATAVCSPAEKNNDSIGARARRQSHVERTLVVQHHVRPN